MERGRLPSAAAWPGLACVLGRFAPLQRPRRLGVTRDPLSGFICFVLRCVLFVLDSIKAHGQYPPPPPPPAPAAKAAFKKGEVKKVVRPGEDDEGSCAVM